MFPLVYPGCQDSAFWVFLISLYMNSALNVISCKKIISSRNLHNKIQDSLFNNKRSSLTGENRSLSERTQTAQDTSKLRCQVLSKSLAKPHGVSCRHQVLEKKALRSLSQSSSELSSDLSSVATFQFVRLFVLS